MSLEEWARIATDAAGKPGRGPRPGSGRTNIPPINRPPPPPERRCQHVWTVGERAGKQCPHWAIKGASRCYCHGGIRDVPTHRAAIKLVRSGMVQAEIARRLARQTAYLPEHRAARIVVAKLLKGIGINPLGHAPILLAGILAYEEDDAGRAWRRWSDTITEGRSPQDKGPTT